MYVKTDLRFWMFTFHLTQFSNITGRLCVLDVCLSRHSSSPVTYNFMLFTRLTSTKLVNCCLWKNGVKCNELKGLTNVSLRHLMVDADTGRFGYLLMWYAYSWIKKYFLGKIYQEAVIIRRKYISCNIIRKLFIVDKTVQQMLFFCIVIVE